MRQTVMIVRQITTPDEAGFAQKTDELVQSGTGIVEQKSEESATDDGRRRSTSSVECRIRVRQGVTLESGMTLITNGRRYTIQSAEDVAGRHMWWRLSATEEAIRNG